MVTIKLVWDKANCTLRLGGVTLVAAPRLHPPFHCQAMVEEQDTNLLLGEQTTLRDPGRPAWYLANTLEREPAIQLGSVIAKGHSPLRLLAIVHDIDDDPTCRPESVRKAYRALLQTIEKIAITSVGLPLLGTVHGKLSLDEALALLGEMLHAGMPASLQRVWLVLPPGTDCDCLETLQGE